MSKTYWPLELKVLFALAGLAGAMLIHGCATEVRVYSYPAPSTPVCTAEDMVRLRSMFPRKADLSVEDHGFLVRMVDSCHYARRAREALAP